MEKQEQKNTHGGVRPGAGRKSKGAESRRTTMAISGTASEIEKIRNLAKESGKSTSRFLIELVLEKN